MFVYLRYYSIYFTYKLLYSNVQLKKCMTNVRNYTKKSILRINLYTFCVPLVDVYSVNYLSVCLRMLASFRPLQQQVIEYRAKK